MDMPETGNVTNPTQTSGILLKYIKEEEMQFKDKLLFLMKITQTSNKELAKGLSVDPSLISLLRSGKRKQPHDPNRIRQIALFFAGRCTAAFQRNALSEMLGQSILRSSMPAEELASRLEQWLSGEEDIVEQIIDGISTIPEKLEAPAYLSATPTLDKKSVFYFGEEGRKKAICHFVSILREIDTPCSIFAIVDDNLDWMMSDYTLMKEIQSGFHEFTQKDFTLYQIMPAMNYVNRYTEALKFWLPLYSTGQIKVYYYPRLRDNLYRHTTIIISGRYVQTTSSIGMGNGSNITLVSTEPELVQEYTIQFQEYLSLCRPAMAVHRHPEEFFPRFQDIFSRGGEIIQNVSPLSISTLPRQLLEQYIQETDKANWKISFQMCLDEIPHFENQLKHEIFINMSRLSTVEEIRAGQVPIASDFKTYSGHPCYTPETYILHLRNILRLMDEYENYYFVPVPKKSRQDYNLIVSESGLALLIRTTAPVLMLEIHRPELVQACREHLLRIAEKGEYNGIGRTKVRMQINSLIEELQK